MFGLLLALLALVSPPGLQAIHDQYIQVPSYAGYGVVRTVPKTAEEVKFLANLPEDMLDFWTEPGLNRNVDIMAPAGALSDLKERLVAAGLQYTVMVPDVQRLVDEERASIWRLRAGQQSNFSLYNYNEYTDIVDHLSYLA